MNEQDSRGKVTVKECYRESKRSFRVTETRNLPHVFIGEDLDVEELEDFIVQGTDVTVVGDLPATMIFEEDQETYEKFKEGANTLDVKNLRLVETHNYMEGTLGDMLSWREVKHHVERDNVKVIIR